MRKGSKKRTTIVLVLLFLIGALMFIWPMVSEVTSYEADDEEYGNLAEQIHAPEPSPEINPPSEPSETIPVETESPDSEVLPLEEEQNTPPVEEPQTVTPSPEPEATVSSSEQIEPESTQNALPTESSPVVQTGSTPAPATAAPQSTDKPAPSAAPTVKPQTGVDLEACLEQNRDFVAWITIPGTVVDYPVVRSDNTEHYLHHLFTGKQSKLGTLFSLKSSDYRMPSRNIAIYGHHLSHSDAMFSTLLDYKDPNYFAAHSVIHLDTLYGRRDYRIFAVINMKVTEWNPSTASFASDADFLAFIRQAQARSLYDTGVEVTASDRILTLITCDRSYAAADGRLIVLAVEQ